MAHVRLIASLVAGLWVQAAACAQTSVTLRSSARVAAGAPITIGDVASVQGVDAERLAGLPIAPSAQALADRAADAWITIDIDTVRTAIEQGPDPINWGQLTLSGSRCAVRVGSAARAVPAPAGSTDRAEPRVFAANDESIRSLIVQRLADLYGVSVDHLRLTFSSGRDDSLFLDSVIDPADRVQVDPGASGASGRVPIRVSIYRGQKLVRAHDLSVQAQLQRRVAVATRSIERDEPLEPAAFTVEERWISPSAAQGLNAEGATGTIVRRRIAAGAVITPADVQAPVVVRRGDEVWVHVLSHGIVIKAKARSLGQARDGGMVKLQVDGSKKTFDARMSGRGIAVMTLDGPIEPQESESVQSDSAIDAGVDAPGLLAINATPSPARSPSSHAKIAARQESPR